MKVLIWIGCIFVMAVLNVAIKPGGIPAVIIFSGGMWVARKLCQVWDEKHVSKKPVNKGYYQSQDEIEKKDNEMLANGGWKCKKCGKVHPSYTGTCGCGGKKE